MGGFFSLDGPFYKFGTLLADIMIVGVLWLIFCIPIFTAGASTTALFYVMLRRISNRETYIARDFWKSFKANFKIATLVWLVIGAVALILIFNIYNAVQNSDVFTTSFGGLSGVIYAGQFVIALEALLLTMYIFPLISRFEMKFTGYFKTAFFMANKHILTSVCSLAVLLAVYLLCSWSPILIIFSGGIYAFVTSYMLIRVMRKYRPDLDTDTPLDEHIAPGGTEDEEQK